MRSTAIVSGWVRFQANAYDRIVTITSNHAFKGCISLLNAFVTHTPSKLGKTDLAAGQMRNIISCGDWYRVRLRHLSMIAAGQRPFL